MYVNTAWTRRLDSSVKSLGHGFLSTPSHIALTCLIRDFSQDAL